jgi:hypothetical protein
MADPIDLACEVGGGVKVYGASAARASDSWRKTEQIFQSG